jgi:hypothetical protein
MIDTIILSVTHPSTACFPHVLNKAVCSGALTALKALPMILLSSLVRGGGRFNLKAFFPVGVPVSLFFLGAAFLLAFLDSSPICFELIIRDGRPAKICLIAS